jgi:hypothetical protein
VAFLNWRFGLTQMTLWRIEVAPFPGLSYVATPTKAIITIPITLYGYGNGDDAEEGGVPIERNGREHGGEETCSSCIQLQRLAHHAHRFLVQPVQVGLLAQPWRRTRPEGLCQVSTFYTILVKKSQQANRASELRRTLLPRTRVNKGKNRSFAFRGDVYVRCGDG